MKLKLEFEIDRDWLENVTDYEELLETLKDMNALKNVSISDCEDFDFSELLNVSKIAEKDLFLLGLAEEDLDLLVAYLACFGRGANTPGECLEAAREQLEAQDTTPAAFAREFYVATNGEITGAVAYVDWDIYWEQELRHDYVEHEGFIFRND